MRLDMTDDGAPDSKLVLLANADPRQGRDAALSVLDGSAYPKQQVEALRALGIAARLMNRYSEAVEHGKAAERLAEEVGDREQQGMALLDQASALTLAGEREEAKQRIGLAEGLVQTKPGLGACHFQRGFAHTMAGEFLKAAAEYETARSYLEGSPDSLTLRKSLQNLAGARLVVGDLDGAEEALAQALEIAQAQEDTIAFIGLADRLGRAKAYRGDIPASLEILGEGDRRFMEYRQTETPQHVTRVGVLTSAGLFAEAEELAVAIGADRAQDGDLEHAGDALLAAARAAAFDRRFNHAADWASEAEQLLLSTDRQVDALRCRQIVVEARYQADGPSVDLRDELTGIVRELARHGRVLEVQDALILAAKVAREIGDESSARELLSEVTLRRHGPIESRLQFHLAATMLHELDGDEGRAARSAAAGLRLLDRSQGFLGGSDLRMGMERHGEELGRVGLRLAVDAGRPRRVLAWMERTRASALRYAPVVPEKDEEIRGMLAELRQVETRLRTTDVPEQLKQLQQSRRRIQERVSRMGRSTHGKGQHQQRASADHLVASLDGRTLVEIAEVGDRLAAVIVCNGRATLHDVGLSVDVGEQLARVRFSMRRAARLGRPLDMRLLEQLENSILPEFDADGMPVVISPPKSLMAAPWAALPRLAAEQVVLAPSAEMWWRSTNRQPNEKGIVVAVGPDLDLAIEEADSVRSLYLDHSFFDIQTSPEDLRDALTGTSLAHIAAHATFNVQNPMFSSIRLADGDLNIYDLERVGNPPSVVVLSACDSGYSETRPGEELAGLTSTLLSMGTKSVIASVGLVPDSHATKDLMVALHKRLSQGIPPAEALAAAQSEVSDTPEGFLSAASFVCVGS